MEMELYVSETQFILARENRSLWISRKTGAYSIRDEEIDAVSAECLGTVYGFLGKITFDNGAEPRLVFVQKRSVAGHVKGSKLYRINSILIVPLESECELMIETCQRHAKSGTNPASSNVKRNFTPIVPPSRSASSNQTSVGNIAQATSLNKVKSPAALTFKNHASQFKRNERSDKVERRIMEEFQKMFTEAESFFYSETYDLTNSIQRQSTAPESTLPMWKKSDDRFFWNIHLLQDLIKSHDPAFDPWIVPVMQGFVQTAECDANSFEALGPEMAGTIEVTIVSRRSRHRPGTRYLRRGVDETGNVANYVETEQIVTFNGHTVSYVQVRGSIPVYWTQMGYKYRPPPRLERSEEENIEAFTKHLDREKELYGPITIINLVEKNGKEKVLGDAYLDNVIKYNSENICYYAFDFHEACGGMRFENVSRLIDKLSDDLKTMNYCWVDKYGIVLSQQGICRINCVDCLDRTNVVETHIAKHVLCIQLSKLGLLIPGMGLPIPLLHRLQSLWANNGDIISKQYAGTNALKGDFTRTGERKLAGALKDGMNSANRYYLNRFKDSSRQSAIDFILGLKTSVTEDDLDGDKNLNEDKENTLEHLKQMIEDVKKSVVPTFDVILGSWGFVNARNNEHDISDIDTIFILTDSHYYVTEYDCMLDTISETQKVPLGAVETIEIGTEPCSQSSPLWSIFQSAARIPNVRINYDNNGMKLFHQFRSSTIRFFNNTVISISNNPDEMMESLKMFADALEAAVSIVGNEITVIHHEQLPPKEVHRGTKMPAVASSWVHKYFSFGSEETYRPNVAVDITQNTQQDRSNIKARRGSLISTPSQGDSGIDSVSEGHSNILSRKRNKGDNEETLLGSEEELGGKPLSIEEVSFNVEGSGSRGGNNEKQKVPARTPVEGRCNFLTPMNDLVLSSCGIVCMHNTNYTSSLSALLAAHELIVNVDGLASPVTPPDLNDSRSGLLSSQKSGNQSPANNLLSPSRLAPAEKSILSRHRHSLPVNSLSVQTGAVIVPKRSITPEITITEEPAGPVHENTSAAGIFVGQSKEKSPGMNFLAKRMARSTEDMTQPGKSGLQSSIFSGLNSLKGGYNAMGLPGLSPPVKQDNRSTSDVDIFTSVTTMKGSHSENLLRQNANQPSSTKKDLVFAPLGKLARGMQSIGANYLDPRKLKGSFKNPKIETIRIIGGKKENVCKEVSSSVQERIKSCKSRIVDV